MIRISQCVVWLWNIFDIELMQVQYDNVSNGVDPSSVLKLFLLTAKFVLDLNKAK